MLKKPIFILSLSIVFLLLLGVGLAYASDESNPGDILYPLDKASEGVQRFFISDPVDLAEFETAVLEERYEEINSLESEDNQEIAESVIDELNAQQEKVLASVENINTLRIQNKIQESEHLKIMTKLQIMTEDHKMVMEKYMIIVNDEKTVEKAKTIENKYNEEVNKKVKDFEEETGLQVEENEQNAGEESQIQNQNEIQNGGEQGNSEGQNSNGNNGSGNKN